MIRAFKNSPARKYHKSRAEAIRALSHVLAMVGCRSYAAALIKPHVKSRGGVDHLEKRETMEIGVARADLSDSVLAH